MLSAPKPYKSTYGGEAKVKSDSKATGRTLKKGSLQAFPESVNTISKDTQKLFSWFLELSKAW